MSGWSSCYACLFQSESPSPRPRSSSTPAHHHHHVLSISRPAHFLPSSSGAHVTFMHLHDDEMRTVMSYLDYTSLLALSLSSRTTFHAASTRSLWNTLPPTRVALQSSHDAERLIRYSSVPTHTIDNDSPSTMTHSYQNIRLVLLFLSRFHSHMLSIHYASFVSIPMDLDVAGELNNDFRSFLRTNIEPACRQGCELELNDDKRVPDPRIPVTTRRTHHSLVPTATELIHILDIVSQKSMINPTHKPRSIFRLQGLRLRICEPLPSESVVASSASSHNNEQISLSDWQMIFSHPSLHHLTRLELHPAIPLHPRRPTDRDPSAFLPLGVLSHLSFHLLQQLTHLKLFHPNPDDPLLELTAMSQLRTLSIRGFTAASLKSIKRCQSVQHVRLLDGLYDYVYNGRMRKLLCEPNSAVTRMESFYLGWNCWQPLESPWATRRIGDMTMSLPLWSLFNAFSMHLTQLVQLELEGCFSWTLLTWNIGSDSSIDSSDLAQKVDWSDGRHAGVLSLCSSLRRLILHNTPKLIFPYQQEALTATLRTLSQLTIILIMQHQSVANVSATFPPSLLELAPRLQVNSHPAELRKDYVAKHGEAF